MFNVPLIDKEPEDDLERANLCDPGGQILRRFLESARASSSPRGPDHLFCCSNTAYEALDGIGLKFRIVGLELVGDGFGAHRRRRTSLGPGRGALVTG